LIKVLEARSGKRAHCECAAVFLKTQLQTEKNKDKYHDRMPKKDVPEAEAFIFLLAFLDDFLGKKSEIEGSLIKGIVSRKFDLLILIPLDR
jgi:hypothetical protein